jgi:16S rRNA (cytosine967-C5)-methyltransferase
MPSNARDYAFDLVTAARLPGWGARPAPPRAPADSRDRALGEAIAKTVIKNLLLLRHATAHYTQRRLRDIDAPVQIILAIALAQLRFFDRVPASAAVDEAVEQAKRKKLGRAAGFVNATLRRAAREPDVPLPSRADAALFAETVLSHPRDVFGRFAEWLGVEAALRLCEKNNAEAPIVLRLNEPATPDALLALAPGVTLVPHEQARMVVVQGATERDFAAWAAAGLAQVQDPTSAAVIDHLALAPGQCVLDRCCGVGTKTLQMATQVGPAGRVVAIDPAKARIARLNESLRRRGIEHVQPRAVGMLDAPAPDGAAAEDETFDRILIDAPCSNSGVIIRRPEARYRQGVGDLRSLQNLQHRIIADTLPHLRPGGLLVYSTCSIWPEENDAIAAWIAQQRPDLALIDQATTLPAVDADPTRHHDGGFVAVFQRTK